MTNQNYKSLVKEYLSNRKFLVLASILASLAINLLLTILLIAEGINFLYVAFPLALTVFDVVFFIVCILTNFKFSYSTAYVAVYCAIFLVTSLGYSALMLNLLSDDRAMAITYTAFILWAVVGVVSVISILFGVRNAGSTRRSVIAALSLFVMCATIGVYAYYVTNLGFFGQGTDAERPVTFVYDEKEGYYVATGVIRGRGTKVIVPSTFNGVKVGAVDCSIFTAMKVEEVTLTTSDLAFRNVNVLSNLPEQFSVRAEREDAVMLAQKVYRLVSENAATSLLLNLAHNLEPSDLMEDEVCVRFTYDTNSIKKANGQYIPLWIAKKGTTLSLTDHAGTISYVKDMDRYDESLLSTLYRTGANGGGYILSNLLDAENNLVLDQIITQKLVTVPVTFDRIYRLEIAEDNDTKYEVEDSFRYLGATDRYRYVSVATADTILGTITQRQGFSLDWYYYQPYSGNKELPSLSEMLSALNPTTDSASVRIVPQWSLNAPTINACLTQTGGTEFTYGDRVILSSDSVAPHIDTQLSYKWTHKSVSRGTSEELDIEKIRMTDAGEYQLTVTASSSTLTSLTSTATQTITLDVKKKTLPIEWVGFDGGTEFSRVYTAEASSPAISYDADALVFADDNITYDFTINSLRTVGDYNISVYLNADCATKYVLDSKATSQKYSITKKAVVLSWGENELTYVAEQIAPTVMIAEGICLGDSLSVSTTGQTNTGKYEAKAVLSGSAVNNYTITEGQETYEYSILPATLNIEWTNTSQVYQAKKLKPTATPIGLQGKDTVPGLGLTLACDAQNAGEHTATVTITNKNYTIANPECSFEITKAPLTLSYTKLSQTYAAAPLSPTYTVAGICSGDTQAGLKISITSATNVGTHDITATTGNANYYIDNPNSTLTITAKVIKISWGTSTLTYNGEEQAPTFSTSDIFATDKARVSVSLDPNCKYEDASASTHTAIIVLTDPTGNYVLDNATKEKSYTIQPKSLTLTWTNLSFTYDGTAHLPTATIAGGVISGDSVIVTVTGEQITAKTNATATASIDNTNYKLANATKSFTVNPKSLELTWEVGTYTYDGTLQAPDAYIDPADLVGADAINVTVQTYRNAGPYTTSATIDNTNYKLQNPKQAFVIAPRTLTVTWTNTSFVYNAKDQKPTASVVSGLVSGDSAPIIVDGAQKNVGTHTATARTSNSNYTVENNEQTFTITPLTVTVSFSDTSLTYNGKAQKPTAVANGTPTGDTLVLSVSVNGNAQGQKNCGSYLATASTTNTNYVLDDTTITAAFTITQKELTVTWSNVSLTYTGSAQKPTATLNGVVSGDTVTPTVTVKEGGTDVGTYLATVSINNDNYTIKSGHASVAFSITKKSVSVNFTGGAKFTYDGTAKTPSFTAEGVTTTVKYEVYNGTSYIAIASAPTNIGRYRITVETTSPNHTLTNYTMEFTIVAQPT